MSFLKNMYKNIREKQAILNSKYGLEICKNPVIDQTKKIYFLLANAILNFMVVIGMLGCIIKPFKIKCNLYVLVTVGLVIAVFLAFLYYNLITKIVGYFIIVAGFTWSVFQYRMVLKGGFAFITNTLMEFFEKDLDLPIQKRYNVYGNSEHFAVTLCVIFIAFTVMLLFNMVITEAKGYTLIFLMTFPFTQIPLYFELKMPKKFIGMYIVGLLLLYMLRNTKHYKMEYKNKKGYSVKINKKTETTVYDYVNDGKNTIWIIGVIAVISIAVLTSTYYLFPEKKFKMDNKYREYRENTRDFTKELILKGFTGMFMNSSGGVGRSRLGQSKYVSLDYETDLRIQKELCENEGTLYLKSFIGSFYVDEFWQTIREYEGDKVKLSDYGIVPSDLSYDVLYNAENTLINHSKNIKIINVDANPYYYYMPYNMDFNYKDNLYDDEIGSPLKQNWYTWGTYYPFDNNIKVSEFAENAKNNKDKILNNNLIDENRKEIFDDQDKYKEYVYDMYLDVPENNKKAIKQFCEKYHLTKDTQDIPERLAEIFEQDYEYTLMPGKTPRDEEFVNYFLTKQKKGYCTYFATSSTLILRYLGIPARYVTGYVISANDLDSGTKLKKSEIDNKIFGENEDVYDYEVNDSQAHAWVEVYVEDYGWFPVETTPPSDEDDPEPEEKNNTLGGFIQNNILTSKNLNTVKRTSANILIILVFSAVIVIMGYIIFGIYYRRKRKNDPSVIAQIDYLIKCFAVGKMIKQTYESYDEYSKVIVENNVIDENVYARITEIVNKEKFSKNSITEEEKQFVKENVSATTKRFYTNLKWYKKIYFKYIRLL